jgi:hypothetical protein
MIRATLIDKGAGDAHKFRWRSHEISRIEGLSDAVFAFAVTLLVVSLESSVLYWHAYRKRALLELNELEVFDTRTDIRESLLNVGIAVVSLAFAVFGGGRFAGLSGMTYMLTPIVMTVHGTINGRRRRKLAARFTT